MGSLDEIHEHEHELGLKMVVPQKNGKTGKIGQDRL